MTNIYKSQDGARLIQERYRALLAQWPVPRQHLRVPTRQGETFIVACGPEDAPPLLLFRGSGANAAMWMRDIKEWATRFRVYAIDVIGEPGLSAPSRPPLASDAYALWLDDVMQALSLERASMIGVSLGGWLVIDYATRRPERVARLVVVSPAGIGRDRVSFVFKALPLLLLGPWGRRKAMRMAVGEPPSTLSPMELELGAFTGLVFKHFRPRLGKKPIFDSNVLKKLTMPVLVIVGAKDAMLDSHETKRRLEQAVPHATICLLPDASHVIREQATPVLRFLRNGHADLS